ncbi:Fis family transcriptional regulator [Actinosynnema sp. ALI-1.44]|uniref:Fis family transcriptional regulator n=1 Tax=Actinosynnema sp. ALI-1.44 TaxID=1933779 RepID=UPI00097C1F93|nr:Fis family transcriptional regulator [Actinosynnema sp. ALI-1.44]ONI91878.1 Fis family transcriptional regulator [Actinosynnema sp. ALI-1.44]
MPGTPEEATAIVQRIRLITGFHSSERDWIIRRLAALAPRLRSFPYGHVDLEISLKERGGADQRVTLECWIRRSSRLHLVSMSSASDIAAALNEVRVHLIRQLDDTKTRTEPRSNRALRHPSTPEPKQPPLESP